MEQCYVCGIYFKDECKYCSFAYPICSEECSKQYENIELSEVLI